MVSKKEIKTWVDALLYNAPRVRTVELNSPSYEYHKPLRKPVIQTFGERFLRAYGGPELDLVPAKEFEYRIPDGVSLKGAVEDIVSRVHAKSVEVLTLNIPDNHDDEPPHPFPKIQSPDDDDLTLLLALPNLKAIYITWSIYFDFQDDHIRNFDDRTKRISQQIESSSVELVSWKRKDKLIEEINQVAKDAGQILYKYL